MSVRQRLRRQNTRRKYLKQTMINFG